MKLLPRTAAITVAALALVLSGCGGSSDDAFVNEYEGLNGETSGSGNEYPTMDIHDEHRFTYASEEQIRELLTDGDGAIYFGFPECPWCRNAVPVMTDAAEAVNLDEIHYLNVLEMRDQKVLVDGEITVDKEGTDFYDYLLEELGEWAPEYPGLEDPSERRILVPLVAVVVGGNVVASHLGTVESQEDPYVPMTDEQREELLNTYKDMFLRIPGCSEDTFYCD